MTTKPTQPIPNATVVTHQILQALNEDKADLIAMLDCLKKETQALEKRDHTQLTSFAEEKSELSKKLEFRHSQREKLLSKHHLDTNTDSWRPLISKLEKDSGLPITGLWNDIESLLKECRDLLQVNEKIVGNMQNNVNQFLNTLRGELGTGQTYNASGKSSLYAENQTITRA